MRLLFSVLYLNIWFNCDNISYSWCPHLRVTSRAYQSPGSESRAQIIPPTILKPFEHEPLEVLLLGKHCAKGRIKVNLQPIEEYPGIDAKLWFHIIANESNERIVSCYWAILRSDHAGHSKHLSIYDQENEPPLTPRITQFTGQQSQPFWANITAMHQRMNISNSIRVPDEPGHVTATADNPRLPLYSPGLLDKILSIWTFWFWNIENVRSWSSWRRFLSTLGRTMLLSTILRVEISIYIGILICGEIHFLPLLRRPNARKSWSDGPIIKIYVPTRKRVCWREISCNLELISAYSQPSTPSWLTQRLNFPNLEPTIAPPLGSTFNMPWNVTSSPTM